MAREEAHSPGSQFQPSSVGIVGRLNWSDSEYGQHTLPHSVMKVGAAWLWGLVIGSRSNLWLVGCSLGQRTTGKVTRL